MNYEEAKQYFKSLEKLKNKFIIASWIPYVSDDEIKNICLIDKNFNKDFSSILNNIENYQIYCEIDIKKLLPKILKIFLENYNLYDSIFLKK
ncbi:hypothetical protein [Mesoplasma corruscae]|uniref:Uncharacterized protein n=1 Tax=Mesoplasma corruscae TaxID=216874 RepID=A0A2S5REV4_9MOLU|nr:hypothetical protein [Mesoplasma corruscae]PPE05665.1 hypothetical protein MCORR_v1c06930 [Mesoplasma corruscae]